jgi:hypothetical protein
MYIQFLEEFGNFFPLVLKLQYTARILPLLSVRGSANFLQTT